MQCTAFLGLGACLATIGCAKPNPLIGVWRSSYPLKTTTAEVRVEFKSDGTWSDTSTIPFKTATVTGYDRGTWKLDSGNQLTWYLRDVDWKVDAESAEVERIRKTLDSRKQQVIEEANKDPVSVLSWNGPDTFSYMNSSGKKRVYTRVKS